MAESEEVTVTFYDNYVPALRAGQFRLTVRQKVDINGAAAGSGAAEEGLQKDPVPPPEVSQGFIVRGPRFKLQVADIHRQFPPPEGTGIYHEYLPMVVFNKRSMPWERELHGDQQEKTPAPASSPAAANTESVPDGDLQTHYPAPWMALVIFTADQLTSQAAAAAPGGGNGRGAGSSSAPHPAGSKRMTLRELLDSGDKAGVRAPHFCARADQNGEKATWTALEDDENAAEISVEVIEIGVKTFKNMLPSWADLPYLAHTRQVSGAEKEQSLAVHNGWHSVLMANRFAVPPPAKDVNKRQMLNIAHIVSLEGFDDILKDADGLPDTVQTVRMISLWSWTFNCVQDPQENFTQLMRHLIGKKSEQGTKLLLRVPPPAQPPSGAGAEIVNKRIAEGYVALEYRLRNGSNCFAWYRGPFSPVAAASFLSLADAGTTDPNSQVPLTATEAMIFDPQTGLFDQSYAAAWSIGRMLALSSQPFATNLLQWRREAHAVVDLLLQRIRTYNPLDETGQSVLDAKGNLSERGIDDLKVLLDKRLVSDSFEAYLADEFATSIARRIGRSGGFVQGESYDYDGSGEESFPAHPPEHRHLKDLMGDADVVNLLHELSGLTSRNDGSYKAEIMPEQILAWLAQLKLLYGVPINYLVPEQRMLPDETIRFFYVDPNWTEALLDGALSIALQSSRDSLFHKLTRDKLHRAVERVVHQVRERFTGQLPSAPDGDAPGGRMAGFLLNSTVVKSWPGLEAAAWYAPDPGQPQQMKRMKPLRMERLSPNILLCIFPEIPVRVALSEPAEGLVFGTEDGGIAARNTLDSAGTEEKGKVFPDPPPGSKDSTKLKREEIPLGADPPQTGSVVLTGKEGLIEKLQALFPGNANPTLGPAAFAVQMVRVPEQMLFDFSGITQKE